MGIESVSQPIGQIINFRKRDLNWYIDGVRWTGAIKTIGATGRDYTDPHWVNEITEDTLFLIDPGTYNASYSAFSVGNFNGHKTYWRGLGSSYNDVKLGGYVFLWDSTQTIPFTLIENIQFSGIPGYGPSVARGTGTPVYLGNLTVNKCSFPPLNNSPYMFQGFDWYNPMDIILKNCSNVAGQYALYFASNLSKTQIIKCLLPTDNESYCTGNYMVDDHVTTPTAGYGPDYGDFGITQGEIAISQPIGTMNLRRNANNVPGEVVAGTIESISQPCGDIIRLKRNTSNIPE